jgi:hypothetical protein
MTSLRSIFRRLWKSAPAVRRTPARLRPAVEALEDRLVPSGSHATHLVPNPAAHLTVAHVGVHTPSIDSSLGSAASHVVARAHHHGTPPAAKTPPRGHGKTTPHPTHIVRPPVLNADGHWANILASHGKSTDTQSPSTPANFSVTDEGGPVLTHPEVETIYVGDYWQSSAGQQLMGQLDHFANYLVTSPYLGVLRQYGAGAGTFTGHALLPNSFAAGATLDDSKDVQPMLQQAIAAGTLAAPDANTLYVVFLPPNVAVTVGSDGTANGLLGYHLSLGASRPGAASASYVIVPNPTGNSAVPGLSPFQQMTGVASHEMAEAITDPQPLTNPAWVDPTTGDEIADIAQDQYGLLHDYTVQYLWSNADSAIVLPGDLTQQTISATAPAISATAGQQFSGTVASFQDPTTTGDSGTYQATINWGDGTTSIGTVTPATTAPAAVQTTSMHKKHHGGHIVKPPHHMTDLNTGYTVTGSHSYAQGGNFTVTIQITRNDGVTASATSQATVAGSTVSNSDLSATGTLVSATAGSSFTDSVATFTDGSIMLPCAVFGGLDGACLDGSNSNYTATIDWGDGSTSSGTIQQNNWYFADGGVQTLAGASGFASSDLVVGSGWWNTANSFSVQGTHTYAQAGNYTITVQITRASDGATTSATSAATVSTATSPSTNPWGFINAYGDPVSASAGSAFTGAVATISNGSSILPSGFACGLYNGGASNYTATIAWGDGSTSIGTVVDSNRLNWTDPPIGICYPMTTPANASSPSMMPWNPSSFEVDGTHTYATAGSYTITVQITRASDGATTSVSSTATVSPATSPSTNPSGSINAYGDPVSASAGTGFSGSVATFSDGSSILPIGFACGVNNGGASNYTATIDWGDGSTSIGTVVDNNLLNWTDPPIGICYPMTAAASTSMSTSPLLFTGPTGSTSQSLIRRWDSGNLAVNGTHTYAQAGSYTVTVQITRISDGATTTVTSTATVDSGSPILWPPIDGWPVDPLPPVTTPPVFGFEPWLTPGNGNTIGLVC